MKYWFLAISLACSATGYANPLNEFEAVVNQCQQSYDNKALSAVKYSTNAKYWLKQLNEPVKISYDVKKTDSLVSPFTAFIEVVKTGNFESATTEEAAKELTVNLNDRLIRTITRYNFLYKNNEWKPAPSRHAIDVRLKAADKMPQPSFLQITAPEIADLIQNCKY